MDKSLKRHPHCNFLVYRISFSNKLMSTLFMIGSILVIFGYSEAYGQTMVSTASGDGESSGDHASNTTR
jgi:hypothetical protein